MLEENSKLKFRYGMDVIINNYWYLPSWGGKSTWGIKAEAIDDHSISCGDFDGLGSGKYFFCKVLTKSWILPVKMWELLENRGSPLHPK